MKRSGFTLIEVMVVLSILAIIAILAYNFFGSTMKEAQVTQRATLIYKQLKTMSDATEQYFIDNGAWPTSGEENGTTLLSSGLLRSAPVLLDIDGATVDRYAFSITDRTGPTAATEPILTYNVGADGLVDVCKKFNELFSSDLGYAVWDYVGNGSTRNRDNAAYCLWNSGNNPNTYNFDLMIERN